MEELTEQAANRLVGAYGESFLRYVLALPHEKQINEALQAAPAELVLILQTAISQASFSGSGDIDFSFTAPRHFGYRPDLGGSLANFIRNLAGGELPGVPSGRDPLVQAIREIAADTWPVLLIEAPKQGPQTFWMSTSVSAFSHPRGLEACKEFMSDSKLASLFPNAPSLDDATKAEDVIGVSANWFVSTGHGGTRQLISIIDAVIFNAAVLAQLDGSPLNHSNIMASIPKSIEFFRKFAMKKPVDVPAFVGFCGLQLQEGEGLKFGEHELRAIRPIERDLLLVEGSRVTSVFETKFAVQLLEASPVQVGGEPDDFFKAWNKHSPLVQEAHRTVQKRIDRLRLSVLLASEGGEYLATTEVARYVADPTQPGGQSSWQMDQRSPASYPLKDGQREAISRFHGLIQEKHPESLDIAMKRILSAVSQRWDAADAFIDAIVVWENAFGTTSETTFRVTGAIAKLLESGSTSEREKLQKELKKLYETRSRLVHGAKEPKPEEAWAQRERAISIALDVLRKLYTERPDLLELNSDLRGAQLLLEG